MSSLLHHCIITSIALAILFPCYKFLLSQYTFFTYNRITIWLILLFSFALPYMHFETSSEILSPVTTPMVQISQQIIEPETREQPVVIAQPIEAPTQIVKPSFNWMLWIDRAILGGSGIMLLWLILQVAILLHRINRGEKIKHNGYTIVLIDKNMGPSSFFGIIMIQKEEWHSIDPRILEHEIAHIHKGHPIDLLAIEILKIIHWFNPFIYLFKKELVKIHEYEADAVTSGPTLQYQHLLLEAAITRARSNLLNQFNNDLIKNRIIMLSKVKSPKWKFGKAIFLFPVIAGLILIFACNNVEETISSDWEHSTDSISFIFPMPMDSGLLSVDYGMIMHPILKVESMHTGLDFKATMNTPVFAPADGIVKVAEKLDGGFGNNIELNHANGFLTKYGHLQSFNVKKGQKVYKGDIIAYVGNTGMSTGPHLHFEIWYHGVNVDPKNYLPGFNNNRIPSISPIIPGEISRIIGYGMRMHPILKVERMHAGVDLKAAMDTEVLASADGTVSKVKRINGGLGNMIEIQHAEGYSTKYGHLTRFAVKEGQKVKLGEVIGYVGNTGMSTTPHLHYEVWKDGKHVDPANYLPELAINSAPSILPVYESEINRMGSSFGTRFHPIKKVKEMHNGMDFSSSKGIPKVLATADGIVSEILTNDEEHGNRIEINHTGPYQTRYSHLSKINVVIGQKVKKGDVIGYVGNTGLSTYPHLHYEVLKDGEHVNPAYFFPNKITQTSL